MKDVNYFATCPKGLEQLLEEELRHLGAGATKQTVAGVMFKGTLEFAYKACLWSRFANRILLPIITFPAKNAEELYKGASKIWWQDHLSADKTFVVNFSGVSDNLKHTQFAAQKIKDAIVDQFRAKTGARPSVDKRTPDLRINGVLRRNQVTLSIDLSGESLHRRGYRLEGASAPLKENLAAAILHRANWPEIARKGGSLVDPMCGSGTILIEALLMAADIAPNLQRQRFGFQGWKHYRESSWLPIIAEAKQRAKQGKQMLLATIYGYDIDPEVITIAQANIECAGLASHIKVKTQDVKYLTNETKKIFGLCICNPPYGERLAEVEDLLQLYRILAKKWQENFLNWEAALLTGNVEVSKQMGLKAYKKYALFNGTIPCELLLFHLKPEWFVGSH